MTVKEKIEAGAYKPTMAYPVRFPKECRYPSAEEAFKAARKAYHVEAAQMEAIFKADALEEVGLTGHPKADKAYAMAWYHGHSSGLHEVLGWLGEIAELLLEDK